MANPKVHVKKGDTVLVITGKDAGKKGKILEVQPKKSRVIVEGMNIVKRHTKPTQAAPQGGIVEKEAAMASSNVMLFCPKCNKPTKIAKKEMPNGAFLRQCKHCGEVFEK
ncbi:50S ribosomal protein L24 [Candidatus Formimonas warabiya]|uniref:Large ribosomal subunit protein uL24 n=1 Tax=Formimonas warabiya TaxID=1761012 RepID=A0A3G1KXE1_FORW1|nr:50S ribosomal protein L24 [Candidatus Formimonas warabiya]ATW27126.1 50S ribosomal protein L24 [Candidatus Formimonas warabiya]